MRGSGSVNHRRDKDGGKTKAKGKGRVNMRKGRAQNAFNIRDSDDDMSSDGQVRSEDDEEIDSDEAFESGDDDKFNQFKFSGSSKKRGVDKKQAQRVKDDRAKSEKELMMSGKLQRPQKREIDLNEDSDDEVVVPPTPARSSAPSPSPHKSSGGEKRQKRHYGSDESASDFEDDAGGDLMDLSEMLGGKHSPVASVDGDYTSEEEEDINKSAKALEDLENEDLASSDVSDIAASDSDEEELSDSELEGDHSDVEEEDDSENADALASFISQLDSKRKKIDAEDLALSQLSQAQSKKKFNTEIIEQNEGKAESEYNLAASQSSKLTLQDMLSGIGDKEFTKLGIDKAQVLTAPLAKPIQDRVDRQAAYETVKEEITKWQPAVKALREAEVLKFPLNEPAKVAPNNNHLAATFKPSNDLEDEIDGILKASGMQSEKQVSALEDFEMAKLSVEEVQRRRAELAIMRDLMFRQERKAKRQNKIKSKAYRKVHRREKEKMQAAIEEAETDPVEIARRNEEKRARERMELRHKNTGKWAQKMLARADHGEGSRAAITAQLQKGEELERKIRGVDNMSGEDSSDEENQSTLAVDKLELEELPRKGVFAMKFMRDADARAAEEANRDDFDDNLADRDPTRVEDNAGRRIFTAETASAEGGKMNKKRKARLASAMAAEVSQLQNKKDNAENRNDSENPFLIQGKKRKFGISNSEAQNDADGEQKDDSPVNPWLIGPEQSSARSRDSLLSKDSDESAKFSAKLRRAKQAKSVPTAPLVQLNVSKTLALKDDNDGEFAEGEEGAFMVNAKGKNISMQADLVSKAFAGDDVVAQFAEEKGEAETADAPKEIDETLPGWGSWVGQGVKKRKSTNSAKKFTKHLEGLEKEKRKDKNLKHVIINEKRDKKAKPLMASAVPFPFENKEQYERSLRMPLGPEWATRSTFQKSIMPKVVVKQGKVIDPMEKPFK